MGTPPSSALVNHKQMTCKVRTCLCVTRESSQLRQRTGFVELPLSSTRLAPVEPARSCSAGTSTSLSLHCNGGISNCLNHWDLPRHVFDDLVDELELLNLRALMSGPPAPVGKQKSGMSKSQPCSRAVPSEPLQCSDWFELLPTQAQCTPRLRTSTLLSLVQCTPRRGAGAAHTPAQERCTPRRVAASTTRCSALDVLLKRVETAVVPGSQPSWSVRLLAALCHVGPAVSSTYRQPATHAGSLLEYAVPGRSHRQPATHCQRLLSRRVCGVRRRLLLF